VYPPAPPPYPPRRSIPVLVPHLIWEPVLLLVTAAVAIVASVRVSVFSGDGQWWTMAYLGLLASGLALSLRLGNPNLSVGGVAAASGAGYVWLLSETETPAVLAAGIVVIAAVALGAFLGAVAGLTSVPAWAVSLAGLAVTLALGSAVLDPVGVQTPEQLPGPLDSAWVWLAAFLLISLAGGGLLAIPPVRRLVGTRPSLGARVVRAVVGFAGSSALASLAGLALVVQIGGVFGSVSVFPLLVALAAVLIGGVSAFGGRGGIAGTVLGVALLAIAIRWLDLTSVPDWLERSGDWILVAVAILMGIGLSRLFEAIAPLAPAAPLPPAVLAPPPAVPAPPAAAVPPPPEE